MREQRWPWLLTAMLMLAAAAAAVGSTYLHWLPCRGRMLSGSMLRGYAYGPDFSEACLRRMDGGLPFPYPPEPAEQAPWAWELGVAAMALAGLAWLALVLGLRWSLRTRALAALPSLATFVVGVVGGVGLGDATAGPAEFLTMLLWLSIDGAAVVALIVISTRQPEVRGPGLLRLLVVLWGTTAFGFVHSLVQWEAMLIFSEADWDVPPGTGYLTCAVLIISAILTVLMTLRPSQTDTTVERTKAVAVDIPT